VIPSLMALSGAGTILLAFAFFYFPWQSFVVDQTRQRLFEGRDHWFDFSQKLTSQKDKASAIAIRAELNYMIRMLHEFTAPVLAYCIVLQYLLRDNPEQGDNKLDRLVNEFDSIEARQEAGKLVANAILQITFCMWRRSLLMIALIPVIIVAFVIMSATLGSAKSLGISLEKSVANLVNRPFLSAP
jgi:hypothetical protein